MDIGGHDSVLFNTIDLLGVGNVLQMKQIIDNETGEVIEVEESNELIEKKLYEVGAIDEKTIDFLSEYFEMQERYEIFREVLQDAMKKNNIKKWDNKYFTAVLKDESVQKRLDTERLKEDGIYDKYLKLVNVKPSLMIKVRK